MWDGILDSSRHCTADPPESPAYSTDEMREVATHVARVERLLTIRDQASSRALPPLDQGFYDVELALLADLAEGLRDSDYVWQALARLGTAGEIDPNLDYQGRMMDLVDICDSEARRETAVATARRLGELAATSDPEVYDPIGLGAAEVMIRCGDRSAGEALMQEIIREDPGNFENYAQLGYMLADIKDYESAAEPLRKAFDLAASDLSAHDIYDVGTELVSIGKMTLDELRESVDEVEDSLGWHDDYEDDEDDEDDEEGEQLDLDDEDEDETILRVRKQHPQYAQYFEGVDAIFDYSEESSQARVHVAMHTAVENQIRLNTPPEAREALDRLMAQGMSRHDAIHAIAGLLAGQLWHVLKERKECDKEAYAREIDKLGR